MNAVRRSLVALVALPMALAALAPPAAARAPASREADGAAAVAASFPDLGLTLTLPVLEGLAEQRFEDGQVRGVWRGSLGSSRLTIRLDVLSSERSGAAEPEDVASLVQANLRDPEHTAFTPLGTRGRTYGFVPYAVLARADRHLPGETKLASNTFYLCGVLADAGYVIEVECKPALEGDAAGPVLGFLENGVRYEGPERVHAWTDKEARARFLKDAPEETHDELEKLIRTKHYVILTNSSGGKKFAETMEENYETIRSIYPFEEVEGRKLLPVFLFQNSSEYFEFTQKMTGWSLEQAQNTKGHAWKDYYATWYEAPQDPVHIHEATHQIFANRLGLTGGGSWFQEGVAEYVETRKNDRNAVATQVKKGRAMPLRELLTVETLAFKGSDDIKGGNQAGDLYKQAALLIEFLRESSFGKDHFDRFVHAMGRAARGDPDATAAVFHEVYGVTIKDLERELQAYCKKR